MGRSVSVTPSVTAPRGSGATGIWWRALILVLAGSLIYLNSVSNPFVFDDEGTILENQQIRSLTSASVLTPERELPVAGRPVVNVSFAINYAIGGMDVTGYRLANIAIHVACALLLFGLVRSLVDRARRPVPLPARATDVAFAVALLWVVHPLNTEAVDYLTQRTESMMAMFYLLTLYASVRGFERRHATRWQVVAVLACATGMAAKESMVTAPVMVALVDRLFLFDSWGQALRTRWRLYAALASTWLVLAALLGTGPRSLSAGFSTEVSAWTYLLNQAPIVTRYLRLALWPTSLVANYGWPAELSLQDVLPYFLFVVALIGFTVVALRWRPQLGFLGAWFFITLAPSSSIVPIATEVGAERRMYLALAGVIALVVVCAVQLWVVARPRLPARWQRPQATSLAAAVLLIGVSAALALATVARNREYRSGVALAQVTVERYPTPSAHHVLAENLLTSGRREEAMTHLRLALPGAPRAHYTLGMELYKEGRWGEAIEQLQAFIAKQPRVVWVLEAHGRLGTAFAMQQDWPAAIAEFREVLKITPNNPVAHQSLADALMAENRFDEAIPHYRRYLATATDDVDALNQLGVALGATGQRTDAILTFRQAVGINPRNGAVHRNLALALLDSGDITGALMHANQAVVLQPDDAGSGELLQFLLDRRR